MSLSYFEQIQKNDAITQKHADWNCSACTYSNSNLLDQCAMCSEYKQTNISNVNKQPQIQNSEYYDNTKNDNNQYVDDYYYNGANDIIVEDYDGGAEWCDYDEYEWNKAQNKAINGQKYTTNKKAKKKKKKTISNINTQVKQQTVNAIQVSSENTDNKSNDSSDQDIPNIKMIDGVPCKLPNIYIYISPIKYNHSLKIRIMLLLNHDGYNVNNKPQYKAWKFHSNPKASYKKYNYFFQSARIDIYDELTKEYWNSVTFIPCKQDVKNNNYNIVNNAYIPIYVKMKNTQFINLKERGSIQDMDSCILHYIAQYCFDSRFKDIKGKYLYEIKTNNYNYSICANEYFVPQINKIGINWNIQSLSKKKNRIFEEYKSPIYHRKLWKIFDKKIPFLHMFFNEIFEYLGYSQINYIIIEGKTQLNNIINKHYQQIAYHKYNNNNCKVSENGIHYDITESSLNMKINKNSSIKKVKHYMDVGLNLNYKINSCNLLRNKPFPTISKFDKVFVSQNFNYSWKKPITKSIHITHKISNQGNRWIEYNRR